MQKPLSMSDGVYVVAELGVNHEGDINTAETIIKQLKGSGVAAVKLQSFTPERYISASDAERLERVKAFCLDLDAHKHLKVKAMESGLNFISTPVSEDWVEPLSDLCDALKIASGDIDFFPTIKAVARTKLPVILSTGTAEIAEVDAAVALFHSIRKTVSIEEQLHLLHCVSEYPASLIDCNLLSIPFMKNRYGLQVGWSNHVIGPLACHTAVALGAHMIEVHVTDRKEGRDFRDHALSFEPHEISVLVSELNDIKAGLGTLTKRPTAFEQENVKAFRKGLIFRNDMKAGNVVKDEDILYARPAIYFNSNEKTNVVGRELNKDVKSGHLISEDVMK